MDAVSNAFSAVDDRDLVLAFESLGDNCELGMLQRQIGVEPLGLLRFAGAPLRDLIRALRSRFAGIADPARIRIEPENGEYMVRLAAYNFTRHADVKVDEMSPEAVHAQQCRAIRFLATKLIEDLENPGKILVFRQNEALFASDLVDLRIALSGYGRNTLLWVQPAGIGHPAGSVEVVDDRMMTGYVRRLADRDDVPALDAASWLKVLRSAHMIWRQAGRGPLVPLEQSMAPRTQLTFGSDGNARPLAGDGWSAAEAGFTWTIGERSVLTVAVPGEASDYWLEMQVKPYLAPPLLPRQRLDVVIGGTLVHSFQAVPDGDVGFAVPSKLLAGRKTVEVVLEHPDAASPMQIERHHDARRLAIAFYRMTLACT